MQTIRLDSLSTPCELPSRFSEIKPLNSGLGEYGKEMIEDIFPFERVAQLLQTPRGDIAPTNIREQWKGVIIPVRQVDYHVGTMQVWDDMDRHYQPSPERPGIYSESTFAITALGLHLIKSIREKELSEEKLEELYEALSFWKNFDALNGNLPFEFRPEKDDGVTMSSFARIMQVDRSAI